MLARRQVNTPVVQADADVKQKSVATREVKVKKAGQFIAVKHHVVAKQIGMNDALGQCLVNRAGGDMVLESQLAEQQAALLGCGVRQDGRHGVVPPRKAAQVGLPRFEVLACKVHAGQHVADFGAMGGRGLQLAVAGQLGHNCCWFAVQCLHQPT